MSRLTLLLCLLCSSLPLLRAEMPPETRDPVSTIALQLSAERKTVGDFTLRDSKGELFAVGRFLVSFSSIYEILGREEQAKGQCEFVYVPIKEGKPGKYSTHQMRYWFNFEKSTVHLNVDTEGSELTLAFDFDPTKEFADGTIHKGLGHEGREAGTVSLRIRDPK